MRGQLLTLIVGMGMDVVAAEIAAVGVITGIMKGIGIVTVAAVMNMLQLRSFALIVTRMTIIVKQVQRRTSKLMLKPMTNGKPSHQKRMRPIN